jgi:hypothetical protein
MCIGFVAIGQTVSGDCMDGPVKCIVCIGCDDHKLYKYNRHSMIRSKLEGTNRAGPICAR